jgi:hypothetical protein
LRDLLAELISLVVAGLVVKSKWKDKWDGGRGPLAADPEWLAKLERIVLVRWKIRVLINPTEPEAMMEREKWRRCSTTKNVDRPDFIRADAAI